MRIHADRTESDPPHALRVGDVRRILTAVPSDWIEGITEARLSNCMNRPASAFLHRYQDCLTIYSRGSTPKDALIAILSELAADSLGINTRHWHRHSEAEKHRLLQLIQPLVDQLLPAIMRPKKPFGFHPSVAFHPVSLADEDVGHQP